MLNAKFTISAADGRSNSWEGGGGERPEQEDKCPEKVRSENRREIEQDGSLVSLQFNDTFYP